MEIRIYKSRRRLELWEHDVMTLSYPIGIGQVEEGHKQREGDRRTPEGRYRVCVKNPKSRYYLSLGLDYPNPKDADEGLKIGTIDEKAHRAILEAHRLGKIPPWDTSLGGAIYIHGHLEKQDWSAGCIKLNDPDMEELFGRVTVGTTVTLYP